VIDVQGMSGGCSGWDAGHDGPAASAPSGERGPRGATLRGHVGRLAAGRRSRCQPRLLRAAGRARQANSVNLINKRMLTFMILDSCCGAHANIYDFVRLPEAPRPRARGGLQVDAVGGEDPAEPGPGGHGPFRGRPPGAVPARPPPTSRSLGRRLSPGPLPRRPAPPLSKSSGRTHLFSPPPPSSFPLSACLSNCGSESSRFGY
jgi:hypothetical protein